MRILISGGSGLIGSALKKSLSENHHVQLLKRSESSLETPWWHIEKKQINLNGFTADIVIHLAGENIAKKRWNQTQKRIIYNSRIQSTHLLVNHLKTKPPALFICASAIGYYGHRPGEKLTEKSDNGNNYVAQLSKDWEHESHHIKSVNTRVVNLRTGLVLSSQGGALKKMLPPFRLGLGGRVGNGNQYYSWIHIDDVIGAIQHIIKTKALNGAVNLTAPEPVTNKVFANTLATSLKRPALLPMPACMARMAFGEMANELLLSDTYVIPEKLNKSHYVFKFPTLKEAFEDILQT